jgi:signal transduction histidine kinase/DNA-binding response OmpR family regulator/CHASE3 domain sensor protein
LLTPRTKVKASFGIALVLLVGVGFFQLRLTSRSIDDFRWVEHTHTVITAMQSVDMACEGIQLEVENLFSGFAPATIESLDRAIGTSHQRIAALRNLISDNSQQTARLDRFVTALQARLPALRSMAVVATNGRDAASTHAEISRASADLRQVTRNAIDALEAQENVLLGIRSARREVSLRINRLLMRVVFAGALLMGVFGFTVGWRELGRREAAEQSLRQTATRLTSVLESTLDCVLACDGDFQVIYVNQRASKVLGNVVSKHLITAFPETNPIFLHHFRETVEQRQNTRFEAFHSGLGAWLDVSCYPTPGGLSIYFRDITTQKRLEERHHRIQALLEETQRMAEIGSWEIDADRRVTWSQSMYRIFQRDPALGFPAMEEFLNLVAAPQDRERLRLAYTDPQFEPRTGVYELELDLPTGQDRHLLTVAESFVVQTADGTARTGMRGFVQDVTAIRRNEIALKAQSVELAAARDAAEAGGRAKGAFLATMSHEIRTPLNGVIGMTELLQDTSLSTEQSEYVSTIRKSGEALLAIINDILDFSKIEAGKLDLEDAEFPLFTVIEECVEIVAPEAHRKGLELILPSPSGSRTHVRGDQSRLRQVLLNLLSNAIKFTHHGEVVVTVEMQDSNFESGLIRFAVRDTGVGIPMEMQTRLFQAFSQADSSTTRRFGGTGLGLAISKRLVELMGGEIGVRSEPGMGSTFWFTVRFGMPKEIARSLQQLSGKRILVVDDNETNRRVLQLQLERNGCEVRAVESAFEAIATLTVFSQSGRNFDAILSDLRMPGTDGLTLANSIRSISAFSDIPILILSSHVDRGQSANAAVSEVLLKPVRESHILRSLERLLEACGKSETKAGVVDRSSAPAVVNLGSGRGNILLAEDNLVNQRVATLLLKNLGYAIDVVANGREALDAVKVRRYDVILMDCQMPEMDGYDATRAIRGTLPGSKIPIIALTANALQDEKEKCIAAGMNDYLAKPINREALAMKLAEWMPLPDSAKDSRIVAGAAML